MKINPNETTLREFLLRLLTILFMFTSVSGMFLLLNFYFKKGTFLLLLSSLFLFIIHKNVEKEVENEDNSA